PPEFEGPFDFMREWTLSRFTDDAELALKKIRDETGLPVFVAGFSRGATFAFTLAGRAQLAGLIILDGSFKDFETATFDRESEMAALHKRKQYVSILSRSRGWENRQEMMRRAWQNPEGPALDDRFASAGEQLASTLYNAWGEGGLANPRDGISSVEVLGRLMEGYDRFYPMIQNVEGRAMASYRDDPATPLDDHFGEMSVPIIYFGATNLGTDHLLDGIWSVGYSGSRDVTYHVLENYGHVDVLVADNAVTDVYRIIARWIDSHR
ncbi:MAG: hypothetical protein HUJ31_10435, partial [Pseudomonadales bacterium]|nr:hypothetical protein [Pseudomonadales bacterium]